MREAVVTNTAVQLMIENYHTLFTGEEPYLFKVYYPYYGDLRCSLPIDENEEEIEVLNESYQLEFEFEFEKLRTISSLPPYTRMYCDLESDFELPLDNDEITEFELDHGSESNVLSSQDVDVIVDDVLSDTSQSSLQTKELDLPVVSPKPHRIRSSVVFNKLSHVTNTRIFTPSVECVNSTMNEFNNLIQEFEDPVMKDRLEAIYAKVFHSIYSVSEVEDLPVITPYAVLLKDSNKEVEHLRTQAGAVKGVLQELISEW
ncbi:hypothetical protein AKO1_007945 [Acrasis kona]|uniref:Uncharacterized protein n=1 Tax=Acrasis kona TaxID=1008807 RepID=A0AAW2YQZ1_9EUKA